MYLILLIIMIFGIISSSLAFAFMINEKGEFNSREVKEKIKADLKEIFLKKKYMDGALSICEGNEEGRLSLTDDK